MKIAQSGQQWRDGADISNSRQVRRKKGGAATSLMPQFPALKQMDETAYAARRR
jgi:hypothetical protein